MYFINMAKRLWTILCLFPVLFNAAFAEEGWSAYTGSSGNYSKKILTLGMQFNFINFRAMDKPQSKQVLVFLNDTEANDWYFKVMYEQLGREVSLFEYKTDTRIFSENSEFKAARIKFYLKEKKLVSQWPPFHPEIHEIQRELVAGSFDKKYLLLTGIQSNLLMQTKIVENFDRIILVSPQGNLKELDPALINQKRILWVGGRFESSKLNSMKDRFGGDVLLYERSSSGKNLLMRNMKALDDILAWLKN